MLLTIKERRSVVAYKRAYIALRLSHAAMLRGDALPASAPDYMEAHYALEMRRTNLAEGMQQALVSAIEASVDKAFGWDIDETTEECISRTFNALAR